MMDPVWVTPNGGLLIKEQKMDSFRIPIGYSMAQELDEEDSELEEPLVVNKTNSNAAVELHRRPFRFSGHRTRIDWRALYGIEVDDVYEKTDLDALDRIVPVLCHGDLTTEDPTHLTNLNFIKLFRLAQLTIEYLLHVQDTLASDYGIARRQKHQMSQHLKACRSRIQEQDNKLQNLRKDLKQIKRHVQTYEVLATTSPFSGAFPNLNENQETEKQNWHPRMLDVLQEFKALGNEKSEIRLQMQDMKHQLEELWKVQSNVHNEQIDETKKLKSEFVEFTNLLSELNESKKDNSELKHQKRELESSLNEFRRNKETLVAQITSLESTIIVLEKEKEAMVVKSKEDGDLMSLLKTELGETKSQLLESTSRVSLSDKEAMQRKTVVLKLEQEINQLNEEKETMQRLFELQEEKLKSMELVKSKLKKEKSVTKMLQRELDQLPITNENKIQSLQLTIRKLRARIKALEVTPQASLPPNENQVTDSGQPSQLINNQRTIQDNGSRNQTPVKGSWSRFIKKFPVVMSWNKSLRSRFLHKQEEFKKLAPPILSGLESNLNYKISSMGIDSTNERLDEGGYKEAIELLQEQIQAHQQTLSSTESKEYEDLVAGVNQHLDKQCPVRKQSPTEEPVCSPKASPLTQDSSKVATCCSTPRDHLSFSPLSNGLLRGVNRDSTVPRSSTAMESVTCTELTNELPPPRLKSMSDADRLWSVLNQVTTEGSPVTPEKDAQLSSPGLTGGVREEEEESGFSDYTSNPETESPKSRANEGANASVGSITLGQNTKSQEENHQSDLDDEYSLDFELEPFSTN